MLKLCNYSIQIETSLHKVMCNIPFCLVIVYLYNISASGSLESRAFQTCLYNIAFIDA